MQQSKSAFVVGRSMEPLILEGDTVELTETISGNALLGEIYSFPLPELNRQVLHRLQDIQGDHFFFSGDRQPFGESIKPPEKIYRLERILSRKQTPDAGTILFGLVNLLGRPSIIAPKHSTLYWPWEEIISLGQKHRLTAILATVLKTSRIWPQIPPSIQNTLAFAQYEALERQERIFETFSRLQKLLPAAKPFKGIKLSRTIYPVPSLRIMEDIDLFLGDQELSEASQILLRNGFTQTPFSALVASFYTQASLVDAKSGISVDLHAQLFEEDRFGFPPKWFPFSAEEEFVYLSTHCYLHWGRHGLSLLDLKYFLEKRNPDLEKCFEIGQKFGVSLRLVMALEDLNYWFNFSSPSNLRSQLSLGQKFRFIFVQFFYVGVAEGNLYSFKKRFLQLLLSDSLIQFVKFWRNPVRRKMHQT